MNEALRIHQKLSMLFSNTLKNRTLNLQNPLASIDGEQVSTAMEAMLSKEVLLDSDGALLDTATGAKILTTTEQILFES